jgi:hypothetical protein
LDKRRCIAKIGKKKEAWEDMSEKALNFNGVNDYVKINFRYFPRALKVQEIRGIYTGKIKPLRCKKCNWYFVSRNELMYHIWEFHRKKKGDEKYE